MSIFFFGILLTIGVILLSGCSKDDGDPIDPFIRSYAGVYMEEECGTGGPVQGTITLENASLRITKNSSTTAEFTCSHSVVGNLFTVQAVYENDTSLIIEPVTIDGRDFTGRFTHFKNASGTRWVYLFDDEIECRLFGDRYANVAFRVN